MELVKCVSDSPCMKVYIYTLLISISTFFWRDGEWFDQMLFTFCGCMNFLGGEEILQCACEGSPSIPSECVGLRETDFNCKRGQAQFFFLYYIFYFLKQFRFYLRNGVKK